MFTCKLFHRRVTGPGTRGILFALILGILVSAASLSPVIRTEAASGNMQITPIDYGHTGVWGDCTMLSSGGKNLLMDTYLRDKYDTLLDYLNDHHFYTFDMYLSHYHYDHMHQFTTILGDSRFNVGKVYLPDPGYLKTGAETSGYCRSFLNGYNAIVKAANSAGAKIIYLKKGSSFTVGNAKINILWGCSYKSSSYDAAYINNNSLVAKVTSGTVTYLTCGDIEKETESQILKSGINLSADIFKLSHHGGSTSNTAAFLKKVNPSFAFYNYLGDTPTSFGGGWVEPAINTLKKTCNIYSTRYNGMLTFTVKAGHISVAGERNMVSVNANIKDSAGNIVNVVNYQFNDALEHHLTAKMKETALSVSKTNAMTALPKRYGFTAKFIEFDDGVGYRNSDGSYSKNKFQKIDGETYYFNGDGYRVTGFLKVNGKTYCFDDEGRMLLRWKRVDGKKYLFDPVDGHMHTGWEWVEEKNGWYYLDPTKGYLLEGWRNIGGKRYYLTIDEFYAKTGWQTISGKRYYFDPKDAYLITGWLKLSGKTYYLAADGVMATGTRTIDGKKYTFNAKGELQGSAPASASSSAASPAAASGTSAAPSKIAWNSNSYTTAAVRNSWAKGTDTDMPLDYKTTRNTSFVNNMIAYATYFVGKVDYASSVTGNDPKELRMKRLKSGGKTDCSWFVYHVLHKYGLVEDFVHSYEWGNDPGAYPGGVNIGTDTSKASPGDVICTGKGTKGSDSHVAIYIGGGKVVECGTGKGVIISSCPKSVRQIVHFSCLPKSTGASYKASSSGYWHKVGKGYKFKVGSSYLKNRFQNIDGNIYYLDSNGYRATGWKTVQGKKYYFTSAGKMYLRWKRIDGKKYYFDPITGYMHVGFEWLADQKKWYYLSPTKGYLVEGWQKIDGYKYYFVPEKFFAKTGWSNIGGKKYYFAADGRMLTGKHVIGGKTYDFGTNGVLK